jgi:hypothetical protein
MFKTGEDELHSDCMYYLFCYVWTKTAHTLHLSHFLFSASLSQYICSLYASKYRQMTEEFTIAGIPKEREFCHNYNCTLKILRHFIVYEMNIVLFLVLIQVHYSAAQQSPYITTVPTQRSVAAPYH